jgi:hypothetical protein
MSEEKKETKDERLQKIEDELREERSNWNRDISRMANDIKGELTKAMYLQAESTSKRQEINELIANYSYDINKLLISIKKTKKKVWEYYVTKYQVGGKTSSTEKKMLMESDMCYAEAQLELYKNQIDFFTESRKTVDHIIWSVKNKIQLYNITEMMG